MKIELNYDPVKPETLVRIDGQMTDRSDIYGFLYPVRHCLLQTWLLPSGSWSGLARQLRELSRGEDVELVFSGRAEDFEDVRSALKDTQDLTLRLRETDPIGKYTSFFGQLDSQIALLLDEHVTQSEKKTLADLFPETAAAIQSVRNAAAEDWMQVIATEADFRQADQRELCCCIVTGAYLDSYEKLEKLNSLTRSMRRSRDMICCCMEDPDKRADLAHYAAQYENLQVRFDTREACLPKLERKYGSTYALRCGFRKYERIARILEQCYAQRDAVETRRTQLAKAKNRTMAETRELERSKIILNWFSRKEPYMERLKELINSGITDENRGKE